MAAFHDLADHGIVLEMLDHLLREIEFHGNVSDPATVPDPDAPTMPDPPAPWSYAPGRPRAPPNPSLRFGVPASLVV